MVCKNCGCVLPDRAKFCAKCGQSIVHKARETKVEKKEKVVKEKVTKEKVAKEKVVKEKKAQNKTSQKEKKLQPEKSQNKPFNATPILIGALVVVIILLIVIIVLLATKKNDSGDKYALPNNTISESVTSTIEQEPEEIEILSEEETVDLDEESLNDLDENNSEFIIPDSDTRLISKEELDGLTREELRIARNEIYARKGRIFVDEELKAYFEGCSWYQGTISPEDFIESSLTQIEFANRDIIVEYEKEKGYM